MQEVRNAMREFLEQEASGGLILIACACAALVIANSTAAPAYFELLHSKVGPMSVAHWVNDGLMTLFFLLVGLEIKRELLEGELSTWRRRILPGVCALGGMIGPALIYVAFAQTDASALKGWAIPAATDIAFALAVLSLLGSRAPVSLKIFLTALAILDDLGAVLIIAIFYTDQVSVIYLTGALITFFFLILLNKGGVTFLPAYILLGGVLWLFFLRSGLHATLAGVLLALAIPLRRGAKTKSQGHAPLRVLEHGLHPWVAYFVVPVFGLSNAGVSLNGLSLAALSQPITLGATLGLFLGKQVGVVFAAWAAIRSNLAELPQGATWMQFYGLAVLCGIGFTMSLFIALIAFGEALLQDEAKIGILVGSVASGVLGWGILRIAPRATAPTGKL